MRNVIVIYKLLCINIIAFIYLYTHEHARTHARACVRIRACTYRKCNRDTANNKYITNKYYKVKYLGNKNQRYIYNKLHNRDILYIAYKKNDLNIKPCIDTCIDNI